MRAAIIKSLTIMSFVFLLSACEEKNECQIASKGDPFFAPNKDPLEVSECCASEGSAR